MFGQKNWRLAVLAGTTLLTLIGQSSAFAQDALIPILAPTELSAAAPAHLLITERESNLRFAASTQASVVEVVRPGTLLTPIGATTAGQSVTSGGITSDQWQEVETPSGARAFIWQGLYDAIVMNEYTDPLHLPGISILAEDGVTSRDIELAAAGVWTAFQWIDRHYGTSTPITTIKMFNRDRSPTGEISCCMGNNLADHGVRIMVLHPAWAAQDELHRVETMAHEVLHVWQSQIEQCMPPDRPILAFWLVEGFTQNQASQAMVEAGWFDVDEAHTRLYQFVNGSDYDLASPDWFSIWESPGGYSHFNSHNGYVWSQFAAQKLEEDYGTDTFIRFCEQARTVGGNWENFPAIFRTVTGSPVSSFYASLPDYLITTLGLPSAPPSPTAIAPAAYSSDAEWTRNGCIAPFSAGTSRVLVQCQGADPESMKAGFIIQPANHFTDITDVRMPEGTWGEWSEEFQLYWIHFPRSAQLEFPYSVTFVIDGVDHTFQFVFIPLER